jgi:hypothetical protein
VLAVAVLAVALGAPVVWLVNRTEVTCGVVVAIDQASITDVRGFSLRTSEGVTSAFRVDPARLAPDSFVPGHLREHRALATPVCVTFRSIESPAVALDLQDGPDPGSPSGPTPTGSAGPSK